MTRIAGQSAAGPTGFLEIAESLRAQVVAGDRAGPVVVASAFASPGDDEILMSDAAINDLGVRIESFRQGRWRFADEATTRDSMPPEVW